MGVEEGGLLADAIEVEGRCADEGDAVRSLRAVRRREVG